MIENNSLDINKIEMQKVIISLLLESNDISQSQYNSTISRLDNKLKVLMNKKDEKEKFPIFVDIKM